MADKNPVVNEAIAQLRKEMRDHTGSKIAGLRITVEKTVPEGSAEEEAEETPEEEAEEAAAQLGR